MTDQATGPQPITIKTPLDKHTVELKSIVTGFDQEAIDSAFYSEPSEAEKNLPPVQRANRRSLEVLVLSVNGSTENILEAVLGMQLKDYQYVVAKINEISDPISDKKKLNSKASSASTPKAAK